MQRKRHSIIWTTPKQEFEAIVNNSKTIGEILAKFGLVNKGGNYKTLSQRIQYENTNIAHIFEHRKYNTKNAITRNTIPLEEILIEHSTYTNTGTLKKRLIEKKLLRYTCYECGQQPFWNNKPLVLQLDHINGEHTDDRIENLRILCPHCYSQTETFAGRKTRK